MEYNQVLYYKQQGGEVGRADTDGQLTKAKALLAEGFNDTICLLTLEREFFLARRPAEAILDSAKGMLQ